MRVAASGRWLPALLVFGVPVAALALGHAPWRAVQMAWLLSPAWVLWCWPLPRGRGLRTWAVGLWLTSFVLDAWLRAYMLRFYGAAPDSSVVLTAVANATGEETAEYLRAHAWQAGPWLLGALGSVAAVVLGVRGTPPVAPRSRTWLVALLVVVLLPVALKPSRRLLPVVFWAHWAAEVVGLQRDWQRLEGVREAWHQRAASTVRVTRDGPSTVVVVLTDSVNRDNLQLYGYPRATSPGLSAQQARWGAQWARVQEAWSTEPSTVPALEAMWRTGPKGEQHLLALARAAGYRVWWVSNHDDLAVKSQHGRMANTLQLLNRVPGRSTRALDDVVLPALDAALADPAPRKLVVMHLLGAHQHYHLRFPADGAVFDAADDAVRCQMQALNRPAWLQAQRDDYDAALRFHEGVVTASLEATARAASASGRTTWLYVSDHGQEVGHTENHAGHSPGTASGYRIPLLLWRSAELGPWPEGLGERPFRADWWSPLMADVLGLDWPGLPASQRLLGPDYRWEPPAKWAQWARTAPAPWVPGCLTTGRP